VANDGYRVVIRLGSSSTAPRLFAITANIQWGWAVGTLNLIRYRRDWPDATVRSLERKMAARMIRG
jgi:hypothetical protein